MKLPVKTLVSLLGWSLISWGQSAPDRAEIRGVTMSGSGCEDSAASVTISPDFKDLSLLFDNHSVEIGNGSPNPKLLTLQSWQYAFKSVDYRGFVALPTSAYGFHRLATMSANSIVPTLREVIHKGPINQDYTFHVESSPTRYVWSSCISGAHTMIFYSQLGVSFYPKLSDRSNAIISLDSKDFSMRQSVGMVWRKCQYSNQPAPTPSPRRPRF
ncbi:MAG: hypothetical protein B7Y39_10330 [Bdellovibrio sp. 28-41-41]|nr:MAG: hypothetical protein B7Y39_10330 [Bdellovibrio sp. 28-41-41]